MENLNLITEETEKNIYDSKSISSTDSIYENRCRICMEFVNDLTLYCDCKNSLGIVHFNCLAKWIKEKNMKMECEICKSKYKNISYQKVESVYDYNKLKQLFILLIFILLFLYTLWESNISDLNNFSPIFKIIITCIIIIIFISYIIGHGIKKPIYSFVKINSIYENTVNSLNNYGSIV